MLLIFLVKEKLILNLLKFRYYKINDNWRPGKKAVTRAVGMVKRISDTIALAACIKKRVWDLLELIKKLWKK